MQKNMQRNAAVYRIEKTLKEGCDRIDQVYQMYKDVKINDKGLVWNTDLVETLELENLLRKYIIIRSASLTDNSLSPRTKIISRCSCS